MSKIVDAEKKRGTILLGGGEQAIKKQHEAGKLTARERLSALFDDGSFMELDMFAAPYLSDLNAPCDGVVMGYGTVDGRLTYAYAQDFTVLEGAVGENHAKKICKCLDYAQKMGAPVVGMLDSNGVRFKEGMDVMAGYAAIITKSTCISGVVPQICMIMGGSYASQAIMASIADFVFITEKNGVLTQNPPTVIAATQGISPDAPEFAELKKKACYIAKDDNDCIECVKLLLNYLPSNNLDSAPVFECGNEDSSDTQWSNVRDVLLEICDDNAYFEIGEHSAKNVITAFSRLNGLTVGIVANNPACGDGYLDMPAMIKASSFVRVCDCFNIPIITLTDTAGFAIGMEHEQAGISKGAALLCYSYAEATTPKISLVTGKAYGGAYLAMGMKPLGADIAYAWPDADISIAAPETAANILYAEEVASAANPAAERERLTKEYRDKLASPFVAAARGYLDDIIDPAATRRYLIGALMSLQSKREQRPAKKHGSLPL